MKVLKRLLVGVAAAAALSIAGAAQASSLSFQAGTGLPLAQPASQGTVNAFADVNLTSINAVINAAHFGTAGSTFSGGPFVSNQVNVFLFDFGPGSDAGVTLFALWGNAGFTPTGAPTSANVSAAASDGVMTSSFGAEGNIASPTPGQTEAFAFGNALYVDATTNSFVLNVAPPPPPTGFAISNVQNFSSMSDDFLHVIFTGMTGDITQWTLWDASHAALHTGGVGQGLIIAIPLPAPVWMGLAGLAGVIVLRRRFA